MSAGLGKYVHLVAMSGRPPHFCEREKVDLDDTEQRLAQYIHTLGETRKQIQTLQESIDHVDTECPLLPRWQSDLEERQRVEKAAVKKIGKLRTEIEKSFKVACNTYAALEVIASERLGTDEEVAVDLMAKWRTVTEGVWGLDYDARVWSEAMEKKADEEAEAEAMEEEDDDEDEDENEEMEEVVREVQGLAM